MSPKPHAITREGLTLYRATAILRDPLDSLSPPRITWDLWAPSQHEANDIARVSLGEDARWYVMASVRPVRTVH